MLVLSRQKDESIMIGDDVKITVVDVRGDKVRLGISAPKEIPVHRIEIYEAIQREKREKKASEPSESAAEKGPDKERPVAAEEEPQEQPKKVAKKQTKKRAKKEPEPETQPEEQHQPQVK